MTLSVFDAARDAPERIALIMADTKVDFATLAARVERKIATFAAENVLDPRGERAAALVARPTLATVETLLALFAAGTPALVLHARATESERAALRTLAQAVETPADPETPHANPPHAVPPPLAPFEPERIAALVPTSGSTGTPRLARLSHRAFLANARAMAAHYGPGEDRALLALPLAHVGGLTLLTRAVAHRSTLVLFEPQRSLLTELDAFTATAEKHAVTLISLVPTLLARLLERSWRPPASLRAVVLGGAPIPADLVRRARAAGIPVVPTYGLTETCASAASGPYRDRLAPPRTPSELLPSGVPLAGVELRIREGTIEVRGDTLFSGYAGDPASDPGRDWLATHDRGYFDEHGELVVNGRTSDLIITGGENVDPAEVEAALGRVPGVRLACVLGEPDPTFGETVTALLVVEPGGPQSLSELAERLGNRLAGYKRPRRLQIVPELPLTASGKIDRRAARTLKDEKADL